MAIGPIEVGGLLNIGMPVSRFVGVLRDLRFGYGLMSSRILRLRIPAFELSVARSTSVLRRVTEVCKCSGVPSTDLRNGTATNMGARGRGFVSGMGSGSVTYKLGRVLACSFMDPENMSGVGLPTSSRGEGFIGVVGPLNRRASMVEAALVPGVLSIVSAGVSRGIRRMSTFRYKGAFVPRRKLPVRAGGCYMKVCNGRMSFFILGKIVRSMLGGMKLGNCRVRPRAAGLAFRPKEYTGVICGGVCVKAFKRLRPSIVRGCGLKREMCMTRVGVSAMFRGLGLAGSCGPLPGCPSASESVTLVIGSRMFIGRVRSVVGTGNRSLMRDCGLFSICGNTRVRRKRGSVTCSVACEDGSGALASRSMTGMRRGVLDRLDRGLGTGLESGWLA